MPIYSFRCKKCRREFDVEHRMDESHPAACACKGELERIFYPTPVRYNSSGFYSTDKALQSPPDPDYDSE